MPSGSLLEFVEKNPSYPFENIKPLLDSVDITFFNLECPITDSGTPVEGKEFVFKFPVRYAGILRGITGFTLANNHIMDYGWEGLASTLRVLASLKIGTCGAGENLKEARSPFITQAGGLKVAFFCYSNTLPKSYWADTAKPGTAHGIEKFIKKDLPGVDADFKIAVFHWSSELLDTPKLYQRILARYAIDHGADMVVGHHPHVVQTVEIYRGKPIFYSLGNFIFGSYTKRANGMLVLVQITRDSSLFSVIPLKTTFWECKFQTEIADSADFLCHLGVKLKKEFFKGFPVWRLIPDEKVTK